VASRLQLLLISNASPDEALVVRALTDSGYHVEATCVDRAAAISAALVRPGWSAAIVVGASGMQVPAALDLIRQQDADLPCIVLSDSGGEEAAVAAMRAGARDFILKRDIERLGPAIERELHEAGARRSAAASSSGSPISRITTPSPICRTGCCCRIVWRRRCGSRRAPARRWRC